MKTFEKKYLVQTSNKMLYEYTTLALLLIDIARNKEEVTVYQTVDNSLSVKYKVVSIEELRHALDCSINKVVR